MGLKKMQVDDAVYLSNDDWNIITNNRSLLNEEGEITPAAFEVMIAEGRDDSVRWNVFLKRQVLVERYECRKKSDPVCGCSVQLQP